MERDLVELPLTPEVWDTAYRLARTARARGITVPTTDIVVKACADHHRTGLLHMDEHLSRLAELAPDSD